MELKDPDYDPSRDEVLVSMPNEIWRDVLEACINNEPPQNISIAGHNYELKGKRYTGLRDIDDWPLSEGNIVSVPYRTPFGNLTEDEDYQAEIVFFNGCFMLSSNDPDAPRELYPLFNWCQKTEGKYIPNYGNVTEYNGKTWVKKVLL